MPSWSRPARPCDRQNRTHDKNRKMDTTDKTRLKDRIARRVTEFYIAYPPALEQITHTQTVAAYTRLIAVGEGWGGDRLELVETAAWLHDIGCPAARRLYGNSLPVHQQEEGRRLVEEWLRDEAGLTAVEKEWLAAVVGSHHRFDAAHELHFEPLFEADLIVNMAEGYYQLSQAAHFYDKMLTTATGRSLFHALFLSPSANVGRQPEGTGPENG